MALDFVKVHMETIQIVFISNISFENNNKRKSKLGKLRVMTDGQQHTNTMEYVSSWCYRVLRLDMAAEVCPLVVRSITIILFSKLLQSC